MATLFLWERDKKTGFLPFLAVITLISSIHPKIIAELPEQDIYIAQSINGTSFGDSKTFGLPGEPESPITFMTFLLPPDADLKTVSVSIDRCKELPVNELVACD